MKIVQYDVKNKSVPKVYLEAKCVVQKPYVKRASQNRTKRAITRSIVYQRASNHLQKFLNEERS
jgi:hypothetical protein